MLCTHIFADEISITVKPTRGIVGTTSITFHEEGNVTILIYESAAKITENTLQIGEEEKAQLRENADAVLIEYLNSDKLTDLSEYPLTFAIAKTNESLTKSISSRKFSKGAVEIIKKMREYAPNINLPGIDGE